MSINYSFEPELADALAAVLGKLNPYAKYRNDPVAYAREVHGIEFYDKQIEICRALVEHRRVMVKSCNGAGKTKVGSVLAKWFYDCWEKGECIITGPRAEQLDDSIFKEIRTLHGTDRKDILPKASRIETDHEHFIKTTTAKDATAFQGQHPDSAFIIFEEATGIEAEFWEGARGMLATGSNTYWLAIFNPTDNSSQAFIEEQSGEWEVISISVFDHPNIQAELRGEEPVFPQGLRLEALKKNMGQWGEWIKDNEALPTDIRLEEKGQPVRFWRPGPIGDARILGRYPTQSAYSIFGEADFKVATSQEAQKEADAFFADIFKKAKDEKHPRAGYPDRFGPENVPQFGCDVARFGDDNTEIVGKIGKYVFLHEKHNGRDTEWTSSRLKQLANECGAKFGIAPTRIPIKVDDTGVGGGVTDQRGDYYFIPINAASLAVDVKGYPRKRDEMLFELAEQMRAGQVVFPQSFIGRHTVAHLQRQAMSVTYKADQRGRRVAEGKDKIKERLKGRSPDGLDALALAYYGPKGWTEHQTIEVPKKPLVREQGRQLFGQQEKRR